MKIVCCLIIEFPQKNYIAKHVLLRRPQNLVWEKNRCVEHFYTVTNFHGNKACFNNLICNVFSMTGKEPISANTLSGSIKS